MAAAAAHQGFSSLFTAGIAMRKRVVEICLCVPSICMFPLNRQDRYHNKSLFHMIEFAPML